MHSNNMFSFTLPDFATQNARSKESVRRKRPLQREKVGFNLRSQMGIAHYLRNNDPLTSFRKICLECFSLGKQPVSYCTAVHVVVDTYISTDWVREISRETQTHRAGVKNLHGRRQTPRLFIAHHLPPSCTPADDA